jgi:hypothetical protein
MGKRCTYVFVAAAWAAMEVRGGERWTTINIRGGDGGRFISRRDQGIDKMAGTAVLCVAVNVHGDVTWPRIWRRAGEHRGTLIVEDRWSGGYLQRGRSDLHPYPRSTGSGE